MTREYSPKPGANWQTVVQHVETVVPDDEEARRPSRVTRRADARAQRKSKRVAQPKPGADTP